MARRLAHHPRMRSLLVIIALAGCGSSSSESPARSPQQRTLDSAGAVASLRAARFDDAAREATAALVIDPKNAQAAAVRALATYQQAGSQLVSDLTAVLDSANGVHYFDHEEGRAVWRTLLDKLEAVDRDLATASADPAFALELCIACWEHDWNHNGRVDDRDRKLFEIEYDGHGGELPDGDSRRRPTFRFDVGDIDWARAMVSFQRAAIELILAYRWSELDKLFLHGDAEHRLVIPLVDPGRVGHARELVLDGLRFADRCRDEYRAETDDDREWVPNPHQKSHAVPLDVDDALFATWAEITADARRLLSSEEGISLHELGTLADNKLGRSMPDAYIDVGRMLRQPTDLVIDLRDDSETAENIDKVVRGLLGHGYATGMRPSPLISRLDRMKRELDHGDDTMDRKLRYLFWLN
jgi:hypothetical protein